MAEQKKKSAEDKPAPAKKAVAAGVNPAPVYVGGDSLADRLMPHVKKIAIGIGILAIVVTGVFTWRYFAKKKAQKNTSAVIAAVADQDKEVESPDEAATPDDAGVPDDTYPTRQDRAEAVIADLSKAKGGPRDGAALLEASSQLEAGHLDEAEAAYQKLSGAPGVEGAVAREGLGYVAEARADAAADADKPALLQKALEAFQAEQTDDAGPRRAYAMYHEARIQARLGKKDEARTGYTAAMQKAKDGGDSQLEAIAEASLVQLDAPPIKAVPKPAEQPAPAPAPTPAPENPNP